MASHIKSLEFHKGGRTYELTFDLEDPENAVLEEVTLIDGPHADLEKDIDPTTFEQELTDLDWEQINEKVKLL